MPWVWDNVPRAGYLGAALHGVKMPPTLLSYEVDPQAEFAKVVADMSALAASLIGQEDLGEKSVRNIKRVLGLMISRIEIVFDQLKEVEDFFQPAVLDTVCKLANEFDNLKKRKYIAGLRYIA